MTRRRLILTTLLLLLTTFVVAVQHDTFIRRWCLPAPPPATRPLGPLDQVIDEFVVDDAHPEDVLRELERRAGVRIDADQYDWSFATGGVDGTVNLIAGRPPSARQTAIRAHDVDPILLRRDAQWTALPWHWGHLGNDPIREVAWLTDHRGATRWGQRDPVLRFGDKLIVLTTPRSHWLIDQILHEEAEAQHANRNHPAATRPAQ